MDNSIRLATTSTGIDVTGTAVADSYDIGTLGTLGSVATDRLFIATADGLGLQFDFDNSRIVPVGADGSTYNNNVSLGSSGLEFKNLLLSGNATVGGTVTADGLTVGTINAKNVVYLKEPTSGAANGALFIADTQEVGIQAFGTSGHITFDTGSGVTQRMKIDSNGDISFYEDTGTTAKLFWDASAESLGIGTSSPSFTTGSGLEIERAGAATLRLEDTGSSGKPFEIYSDDGEGYVVNGIGSGMPMIFKTVNTERMRIDASGNVRVGVGNTFEPTIQFTNSGRVVGNPGYSFNGDLDTGMFNPSTQGTIAFANNGSESMRIDSAGNLQLGNTTGSRRLNVFSDTDRFTMDLRNESGYNSGELSGIVFSGRYDSSNNVTDMASIGGGKENTTDGNFGGRLSFFTRPHNGSDTERMRIDSSGNVKIGDATTDVTSKLTVSGNASASLATFMYDGAAGTYFDIDCNAAGGSVNLKADARTGAYPPLLFTTGGSESMRLDASGNLLVGATTTTNLSDGTGNDGVQLNPSGTVAAARTSNVTAVFNRLSTDGEIVRFNKDGTTVGSIQSRAGLVTNIILDPRTDGAGLTGTTNTIEPVDETGTRSRITQ
jgi:hypothetical protein